MTGCSGSTCATDLRESWVCPALKSSGIARLDRAEQMAMHPKATSAWRAAVVTSFNRRVGLWMDNYERLPGFLMNMAWGASNRGASRLHCHFLLVESARQVHGWESAHTVVYRLCNFRKVGFDKTNYQTVSLISDRSVCFEAPAHLDRWLRCHDLASEVGLLAP
jgi:hypothetical protein